MENQNLSVNPIFLVPGEPSHHCVSGEKKKKAVKEDLAETIKL